MELRKFILVGKILVIKIIILLKLNNLVFILFNWDLYFIKIKEVY